jgi:alcohol dehydrogenase class IV
VTTLNLPTLIQFGVGSAFELAVPEGQHLLLVSPSMPVAAFERLRTAWAERGFAPDLLVTPGGEPNSDAVDDLAANLPNDLVGLVALGGGSVIDFAKAMAALMRGGGKITDYEFGQRTITSAVPVIAIPTTCGSGSEVTPYAVINNSLSGRKFTLSHSSLRPVQAVIDPLLLAAMPVQVLRDSALDAFTHCLEALLTRADTRLIAPWAEAGLRIAYALIPHIGRQELNAADFDDLARLSLWGGASIAHSRTGLIHTLSVALARYSPHAHGLLNASLLSHALAHNLPGYDGLLARVVGGMMADTPAPLDDVQALHRLTHWLAGIIGDIRPADDALLRQHRSELVDRLLQDKGLTAVSHGDVQAAALDHLIGSIGHAP